MPVNLREKLISGIAFFQNVLFDKRNLFYANNFRIK